jgi:hypothetical protein
LRYCDARGANSEDNVDLVEAHAKKSIEVEAGLEQAREVQEKIRDVQNRIDAANKELREAEAVAELGDASAMKRATKRISNLRQTLGQLEGTLETHSSHLGVVAEDLKKTTQQLKELERIADERGVRVGRDVLEAKAQMEAELAAKELEDFDKALEAGKGPKGPPHGGGGGASLRGPAEEVAEKGLEVGGKRLGAKVLKALPFLGIAVGVASAAVQLKERNYGAASLDVVGLVPGLGDLVDVAVLTNVSLPTEYNTQTIDAIAAAKTTEEKQKISFWRGLAFVAGMMAN